MFQPSKHPAYSRKQRLSPSKPSASNSLTHPLSTSPHTNAPPSPPRPSSPLSSPSSPPLASPSHPPPQITLQIYSASCTLPAPSSAHYVEELDAKMREIRLGEATKKCLRLVVAKRLAEADPRFLGSFHAALREYEEHCLGL